jgi:hypothetical protein
MSLCLQLFGLCWELSVYCCIDLLVSRARSTYLELSWYLHVPANTKNWESCAATHWAFARAPACMCMCPHGDVLTCMEGWAVYWMPACLDMDGGLCL